MGLFDFFKRNRKQKQIRSIISNYYGGDWKYFVWNYANQIYDIPEVRTAIEKVADIFSSIPIYHKRIDKNGHITYLDDTTTRVLNFKPNPLQNGTQLIKNIVTDLFLNSDVFVEPIFDYQTGKLQQLYPLPARKPIFSTDDSGRVAYVQFNDAHGNPDKKYNLNNLIYLNRFSTLTGGSPNKLGLYETVLKSLGEQIVNVADPRKPRAILQSNQVGQGQLKEKDKKGTIESVRADFADNIQGLAYLDKMWTITPINWSENDVNKELMQFVVNIVYNYFGINESIINNKATEIEMEMFIGNTIKPLAIQFEREFTNKLFNKKAIKDGHRVIFSTNLLTYATLDSKVNLIKNASAYGYIRVNEARDMLGLPPLDDKEGNRLLQSLNSISTEIADAYQLGKKEDKEKNDND